MVARFVFVAQASLIPLVDKTHAGPTWRCWCGGRWGRAIVQHLFPGAAELSVVTLDNRLERLLMRALGSGGADGAGIEPGLADTIAQQAGLAAQQQEALGLTPVLLVPGPLRALLSRFLRRALPQLKVLSHSEIPETKTIRVTSLVGAQ
jgi:flagellar biosynthesis protein FlhA